MSLAVARTRRSAVCGNNMLGVEMTQGPTVRGPVVSADDDEISLLSLASILIRWRVLIIVFGLAGGLIGLAKGLTSPRLYVATAAFIPQGSESGASGLALAASQFGIRMPSTGGGWGPPLYVELLHSRALLEPLAFDTLVVAERGGARVPVMEVLQVEAPTREQRIELAVRSLREVISAEEVKPISAVRLSVATEWPSVSLALAERLVRGVNEFNVQTRNSQAAAERRFVEDQAAEAERAQRAAEDRLQSFLQRNRVIANSPELAFERDRLQREVTLRQQIYASLVQNREEARIREVRDIPVITVIEDPHLPMVSEPRRSVRKAILGGIAGGLLATVIAFALHGLISARRAPSPEAREFFALLDSAVPSFLKPRGR